MLRREAISDVKLIVSKQDETFDEAYEEGTFVPLQTFAKQNNIDAESEEQLIRVIQKRWPSLEVGVGEAGCLGVFVTDLGEGEYKYKRGVTMSALRKKDEYYNDGVAATESLEDMLETCRTTTRGVIEMAMMIQSSVFLHDSRLPTWLRLWVD